MEHAVLLRCALPASSRDDRAAVEALDQAIASLVAAGPALELARDERGTLLAFSDVPSAARFALSLRETPGITAAFAIEPGLDEIVEAIGRPPRVFGPALSAVEELVELSLPGQILLCESASLALAGEPDLRAESLGPITLAGRDAILFEVERSGHARMVLPRLSGRFVGRSEEQARVSELFRMGTRTVTLVGPVGVGKTRLALEVAREMAGQRALFVQLGGALSKDDAVRSIARACGVSLSEPDPLSRRERMLELVASTNLECLVLDAIDAIEPAGELVGELLSRVPKLCILVTSRDPRANAEADCVRLGPLSVEEACELFAERSPRSELDLASVTELARALDGLPLAVELCAARSRERTPEELLAELSEPTELDRGLERALLGAHRALDDEERRALGLVAVLPAGLSLEHVESSALRARLSTLCTKSMLMTDADPGMKPRLRMLNCVRRFVLRCLSPAEAASALAIGARCIFARAEGWAVEVNGRAPLLALERLSHELDNLVAIHFELRSSEPELSARAVLVLHPFLTARGPRDLHLQLLDSAIGIAAALDPGLTCELRLARCLALANTYGNPALAEAELLAIDVSRLTPSRRGRHAWLVGICQFASGRYVEAEETTLQALSRFRALDDVAGEAAAHNSLGNIRAQQGRLEEADVSYRTALDGHERSGELRKRAVVMQNLARLASERGDHARGVELHDEALALSQELGDARIEGLALSQSALAAHDRGELETAARHYRRSLELLARTGEWRFRGFGQVLYALSALERADLALARDIILPCVAPDPLTDGLRSAVVAVVDALSGDPASSAASFAQSRARLEGDPHLTAMVHVLEGVLDVTRADALRRAGKNADADALMSSARARMASVSIANAPNPPLAERSCLVRVAVRLLSASLGEPPHVASEAPVLEIAEDASWFRPHGERRVDLSRRAPLRRVLGELTRQRLDAPSTPLSASELIASVWAGEIIEKRAALNRLYVAIATLRRAGLGEALITRQDGYMLDPNLPLLKRGKAGRSS